MVDEAGETTPGFCLWHPRPSRQASAGSPTCTVAPTVLLSFCFSELTAFFAPAAQRASALCPQTANPPASGPLCTLLPQPPRGRVLSFSPRRRCRPFLTTSPHQAPSPSPYSSALQSREHYGILPYLRVRLISYSVKCSDSREFVCLSVYPQYQYQDRSLHQQQQMTPDSESPPPKSQAWLPTQPQNSFLL